MATTTSRISPIISCLALSVRQAGGRKVFNQFFTDSAEEAEHGIADLTDYNQSLQIRNPGSSKTSPSTALKPT
jgi:hypothetical protein